MSHTPGPWSSEGLNVGDNAEMLYLTQDSDHYKEPIRICLIAGHEWKVPKGKRDERCYLTESSVADARLIAAAPELLEALKALASTARTFSDNVPDEDKMWTSLDEDALTAAYKAIAKAMPL